MGYPGSIGAIWHITDAVAVRPDFLFRHLSSAEITESSSTTTGIGIAGIVYFSRIDSLRLYFEPRFAYTRTRSESEAITYSSIASSLSGSLTSLGLNTIVPQVTAVTSTTTTKSGSGSFGAQYTLHRRFSVFGEAGIAYATADSSPSSPLATLAPTRLNARGPRTWATQTAAGVVVYFKD